MRGRRPKPWHLKLLAGNAGRRPAPVDEPLPAGNLTPEDAPAWFEPAARLLWQQVVNDAPAGLLRSLDGPMLASFVGALWLREQAMVSLARYGLVIKTDDGHAKNPYLTVLRQADAVILRAGAELGLSPSSRSRVTLVADRKKSNVFADMKAFDDLKAMTDDFPPCATGNK